MSPVRAVKDPEQSPKPNKTRARSGVRYPYYDLADGVTVATKMHQEAGGPCSRSQLAAILGHKGVNSGAFLTRLSAAKLFGLIESTPDKKMKVTQRGLAIVAPVSPEAAVQAKLDAFLDVELFQKVYKEFDGTTLPADVGLKNLLETTFEVVPDRVTPTVRIMLDSADYAGLFPNGNRSRMVMPFKAPGSAAGPLPKREPPAPAPVDPARGGGGGGGGGGQGSGLDPALVGFLQHLPPPKSRVSSKRREKIKVAFGGLLDVLYPEDEDE